LKNLILISGHAEHGKTALAKILKSNLELQGQKVVIIPIAKYLKIILRDYCDWDGVTKNEWFRTKAQYIGTDIIRYKMKNPLFHIKRVITDTQIIEDIYDYIIFDDCRFPDEVYYSKTIFNDKVITIRVDRLNYKSSLTPKQLNHPSENKLNAFKFDYYIKSESGINNLTNDISLKLGFLYKNKIKEDFVVGEKVKVIQIKNLEKANHLQEYLNMTGFIFSWIIEDKQIRYKVIFKDENDNDYEEQNTAYFLKEELLKM